MMIVKILLNLNSIAESFIKLGRIVFADYSLHILHILSGDIRAPRQAQTRENIISVHYCILRNLESSNICGKMRVIRNRQKLFT